MIWAKSIIGKIGFIDTENKLTYKKALEKIPKNARIMKAWEFLKLADEDFQSLKEFPRAGYFAYATEEYYRVAWLVYFGNDSGFDTVGRRMGDADALRGVLVVKVE